MVFDRTDKSRDPLLLMYYWSEKYSDENDRIENKLEENNFSCILFTIPFIHDYWRVKSGRNGIIVNMNISVFTVEKF